MPTAISQNSAKFMNGKTVHLLIHLHIYLAETIALVLHSKVIFKKLFWLKLFALKNTLHALNSLIPRTS